MVWECSPSKQLNQDELMEEIDDDVRGSASVGRSNEGDTHLTPGRGYSVGRHPTPCRGRGGIGAWPSFCGCDRDTRRRGSRALHHLRHTFAAVRRRRLRAGWPSQIWLARSDRLQAGYRADRDTESVGL
jgi:hypothetical protein